MSGFACWCVFVTWVFFIKRKTAYELRISDWSSDGCSSDLGCESDLTLAALGIRDRTWTQEHRDAPLADEIPRRVGNPCGQAVWTGRTRVRQHRARARAHAGAASAGCDRRRRRLAGLPHDRPARSEERRVGQDFVRTSRSRWVPYHLKKHTH